MSLAALLPLLLALARAIPALDALVSGVHVEREKDRAREAAQRLAQKSAAADAAIDR